MVALTPRFTLLATACSLAALSATGAGAVAVQGRGSDASDTHSSSSSPSRQRTPVLALPPSGSTSNFHASKGRKAGSKDVKDLESGTKSYSKSTKKHHKQVRSLLSPIKLL